MYQTGTKLQHLQVLKCYHLSCQVKPFLGGTGFTGFELSSQHTPHFPNTSSGHTDPPPTDTQVIPQRLCAMLKTAIVSNLYHMAVKSPLQPKECGCYYLFLLPKEC